MVAAGFSLRREGRYEEDCSYTRRRGGAGGN